MSSHVIYYFAVILTYNLIRPVKGQCTVQDCGNGDSSNSIVEEIQQLRVEIFGELKKQVQSIRYLMESLQEMKSQLQTVQAGSIKNQTQNLWKMETAYDIDFGEVPILQSTVNDWIVLMHRFDGSLNFSRNWIEYRDGFGDIKRGEFWLGNEKVHRLTNRFDYTLRIEVYTNGTWFYADYATFSLDSENNKYALRLSGFSGSAGDSLTSISLPTEGYHGGMGFSTWDSDNDRDATGNCAHMYKAGWWFNDCHYACLTCLFNGNAYRWTSLRHLDPNGFGRIRGARMMIKSK